MRFLEKRDQDFDTVKSFLICSMIIAHGFQWFSLSGYNRNLTYYVLVGFVFLSGLTVGAIYQAKLLEKPFQYSINIFIRSFKLLCIFLAANALMFLLQTRRMMQIFNLPPEEIILSLYSTGENRSYFSFLVLIPISFTFVGSIFLLSWRKRTIDYAIFVIGIGLLWVIEKYDYLNYYGIKLLITGLIGVILAKLLYFVDWERIREKLSKWNFQYRYVTWHTNTYYYLSGKI